MIKEPKFEKLEFNNVPRSAMRKNNPVAAVTYGFFKQAEGSEAGWSMMWKVAYYHKYFSAN